jgi:hypothetical protein
LCKATGARQGAMLRINTTCGCRFNALVRALPPPAVADFLDRLLNCCTGFARLLRRVTDFVPLATGYARTILLTASTSVLARHRFVPLNARNSRTQIDKRQTTNDVIGSPRTQLAAQD